MSCCSDQCTCPPEEWFDVANGPWPLFECAGQEGHELWEDSEYEVKSQNEEFFHNNPSKTKEQECCRCKVEDDSGCEGLTSGTEDYRPHFVTPESIKSLSGCIPSEHSQNPYNELLTCNCGCSKKKILAAKPDGKCPDNEPDFMYGEFCDCKCKLIEEADDPENPCDGSTEERTGEWDKEYCICDYGKSELDALLLP